MSAIRATSAKHRVVSRSSLSADARSGGAVEERWEPNSTSDVSREEEEEQDAEEAVRLQPSAGGGRLRLLSIDGGNSFLEEDRGTPLTDAKR